MTTFKKFVDLLSSLDVAPCDVKIRGSMFRIVYVIPYSSRLEIRWGLYEPGRMSQLG